ncbi:MAG: cohesin domain-containing protein [Clostridiales bacterium]|nr:cohesin domain-containing protein [Clostridiales bacterium]
MSKKPYRLITIILAVMLVFGAFSMIGTAAVNSMSALDEPMIKVASGSGKAGDAVDVAISLENNPGVASMRLLVGYDTSSLKLVKVEDKGLLGSAAHYMGPEFAQPYTLLWSNGTAKTNFTANGTIAVLQFEILQGAKSSQVTVTYNARSDIHNVDLKPVSFATENGTVSVAAVPSPTPAGGGSGSGGSVPASTGSIYDLNGDSKVDSKDFAILLLYCGFDKSSSNWSTLAKVKDSKGKGITASSCDVNRDGVIDMLDLIDLFIHYTK